MASLRETAAKLFFRREPGVIAIYKTVPPIHDIKPQVIESRIPVVDANFHRHVLLDPLFKHTGRMACEGIG